jgi:hypothetical protein
MYIHAKFFGKKGDIKPFLIQDVSGSHAAELLIFQMTERFCSVTKAEKIKQILKEE